MKVDGHETDHFGLKTIRNLVDSAKCHNFTRNSFIPNVIHGNTWKEQEKAVLEALENKISSMEKYIQASWDTTQRNYKLTSENKSIFNKLQGIFLNKIDKIFFLNTIILYLRLCYGRTWTVSVLLGSNTSS